MFNKRKDMVIVNDKTGEMISKEEYDEILKEERQVEIVRLMYMLKTNPYSLSTEEIKRIVSIKNSRNVENRIYLKKYEEFETYSTHNKELIDFAVWELGEEAFCCLIKLLKYSNSKNTLQFMNHVNITTDDDFISILKISKRKWSTAKNKLIEYGAIRKIKFNKHIMYKINPAIIGHSMEVDVMTYYAFRDVLSKMFDPLKTLYWDKYMLESYGCDIFSLSANDRKCFYSAYFNAEELKNSLSIL